MKKEGKGKGRKREERKERKEKGGGVMMQDDSGMGDWEKRTREKRMRCEGKEESLARLMRKKGL